MNALISAESILLAVRTLIVLPVPSALGALARVIALTPVLALSFVLRDPLCSSILSGLQLTALALARESVKAKAIAGVFGRGLNPVKSSLTCKKSPAK